MTRWMPAIGMVVTLVVFGVWTAQAVLEGEMVHTASRFLLGIALGGYLLLVHRLTALRLRLAEQN